MRILWRKIALLFTRKKYISELDEEMKFHREQMERELAADGMSEGDARAAAMRQFGNATRMRERSYEMIGFSMESALQDTRFALRQMRRNPGFAVTAVMMLALGIAASVAMFAFVDAALLKPLPYPEPDRLVEVTESIQMVPRANLSYPDYLDWKRMTKTLQSFDVYTGSAYLLKSPQGAEPVSGLRISAGFLKALGVQPILGRDFREGDGSGGAATTLLSYAAWQKRFGGRRDVIGEAVELSGVPMTIIGVLPTEFKFAGHASAEFFTPETPNGRCEKQRDCHNLDGVGRLKPGVTIEQARAEMQGIAAQLERQYPDSNRGQGASVIPLSEATTGDIKPVLLVLLGGAALLLLIACVNVANLLLVRAEKRRQEMAVRGALGASRTRLVRQYVTESLMLVACGSAIGIALAYGAMRLMMGMISKDMMEGLPFLSGISLSAHVWMFAAGIALMAAVIFTLTPMMRLPAAHLREGLSDGGRTGAGKLWRRMGANLVIVELAVAVVLLTGAGLLAKSFWTMMHVDLGIDTTHLALIGVSLPDTKYKNDAQKNAYITQMLDRVRQLPGVRNATVANLLPVTCICSTTWVRFVGRPYSGEHNEVLERYVSASYLETLKAKLERGRFFQETDDATHPRVAVINEAFARKYFTGIDPIGVKIGNTQLNPKSIIEIVGVLKNIQEGALDQEQVPVLYTPFAQEPISSFDVAVRTAGDEKALLPTLSRAVHGIDPGAGVNGETTMEMQIHDANATWMHRSAAWMVGGFAAMALLLGVVGMYGVIAYSVGQRTREIGVRMALGAQRGSVYRLVLGEASRLVVIGVAVGAAGAVGTAMLMRNLLYGVQAWDVETLMAVIAVLGAAAMLASYLPARRAAMVNPTDALRAE